MNLLLSLIDYLAIIKSSELEHDYSMQISYGKIREDCHYDVDEALSDYYDEQVIHERTKTLFSHLDQLILCPISNVRTEAKVLMKFLKSTEAKYFLTGKTSKIHINHRLLEA